MIASLTDILLVASQGSLAMVETLAWLANHGLDATDMDSMDNHWAQSGFTYFVTAHAQWHPTSFDRNSALAKYCAVGFGPHAATFARQYLEFWEAWSVSPGRSSLVILHPGLGGMPFLYTDALLGKAEAILSQLAASCNGYPGCRSKVSFWGLGLKHARLTNAAILAMNGTTPCATDRACDLSGGFLQSALALIQFRRQIASSSAVNVFEQSMAEVNDHDVTGIAAAAGVEPLILPSCTPAVQMCENDWVFAFDPTDIGETSAIPWFSPKEPTKRGGANGTRWMRMSVGLPWNSTAPGKEWAAAHGGDYSGVGWYRTIYDRILVGGNATKLVMVANVSGAASAWLNGLPLSAVDLPAEKKAEGLVAFDVTNKTKWTGKGSEYQEVAIRVDGKGMAEAGVVSLVFLLRGNNSYSPAAKSDDESAVQWQPWEAQLTASGSYANPYSSIDLLVNYTGPDGRVRHALGFWDGGSVWKIRSFFDRPGRWGWQTSSADHGLRQSGTVTVAAKASGMNPNPFFTRGALRVSEHSSHLEFADTTPFFWLGDTAWAGPMRSTPAEWTEYLAARKEHGFTVVQSGIACPWAGGVTRRGDLPFNDTGNNLTKLNPGFFQVFADRIGQAAEAGMAVLVVGLMEPSYRYPTLPEATRFARHLTARLSHYNSIIFSPSFDSGYQSLGNLVGEDLVAAGVKGHQLLTLHPGTGLHNELGYYVAGGKWGQAEWVDFYGEQTGYGEGGFGHTGSLYHRMTEQAFFSAQNWTATLAKLPQPRPVIDLEEWYDSGGCGPEVGGDTHPGNARTARGVAYIARLSGAVGGTTYGTQIYVWNTTAGSCRFWRTMLELPSAGQMGQLRWFFEEKVGSPSWTQLVPRPDLLLADAPGQTDPTHTVALATTPDGLRVAYLPNNTALMLAAQPGLTVGSVASVRWWDPASNISATGACVAAVGGLRCPKPKGWTADALAIVGTALHVGLNRRASLKSDDDYTRHSSWWRPVGCGTSASCQNTTLTSLRNRFGSWDTFSPTVARVYNGSADIVTAGPMTPDVIEAIVVARQIGYRVVPILEVDCGKVIGNANSTQDFKPSIDALVALAAAHCFDGYTLDMICGDLEKAKNSTTTRFVTFVGLLKNGLNSISNHSCVRPAGAPPADKTMEVNWFAHGGYKPQAALPNKARSCFSEDTYRCKKLEWTLEGVRGWVGALGSEAGIGLEPSPTVYFESAALHGLVAELLKLKVRSVGTWGTFEQNKFADLWALALRNYLLGNSSGY